MDIDNTHLTRFGKLPSVHVREALEALIEAEKPDSPVKPRMSSYHQQYGSTCFACLGGLAAIREFGIDPADDRLFDMWNGFRVSTEELFPGLPDLLKFESALDSVRIGIFYLAFGEWGLDTSVLNDNSLKRIPSDKVPEYADDPQGFKAYLEMVISELEKLGY